MKRNLVLSSIAAFGLMAAFAVAGTGFTMHISVPFDFYLEDQLVPAGEYRFDMASTNSATASFVTVRSTDGKGIRMLAATPGVDPDMDTNHLRFNKYGDKYFLYGISIRGHRASLKTFKLEKELRSQIEKSNGTVTIAQN